MNYFSLASQNSKLVRNEAFSAEILQQKEICEAYTFHIIYMIQCTKHKNNVLLQIFDSLCIKTQENHGKHKCSSIAMQIFICR